jgi:hypothetical protein
MCFLSSSVRVSGRAPGLAFLVVALATSAFGQTSASQSLGDLARKQKQKQQAKEGQTSAKKVVTNEDIPEHPEEVSDSSATSSSSDEGHSDLGAPAARDVLRTGDQWKAAIQQQKNAVAELRNHIGKLQDSIHFVEANRYRNGMEYNKVQVEKQKEVQRLQGQLDEYQKSLEQMQESARKAGFGSSVWDP